MLRGNFWRVLGKDSKTPTRNRRDNMRMKEWSQQSATIHAYPRHAFPVKFHEDYNQHKLYKSNDSDSSENSTGFNSVISWRKILCWGENGWRNPVWDFRSTLVFLRIYSSYLSMYSMNSLIRFIIYIPSIITSGVEYHYYLDRSSIYPTICLPWMSPHLRFHAN